MACEVKSWQRPGDLVWSMADPGVGVATTGNAGDMSPVTFGRLGTVPTRDGGLPKKLGLQLDFWVHSFHATPIGLMLISPEVGVARATPTYTKPPPLLVYYGM